MKKLLLNLLCGGAMALMVLPAYAATDQNIYVVGDYINGESVWNFSDPSRKMSFDAATNTYTWTGESLGNNFKLATSNWSTVNLGSNGNAINLNTPYKPTQGTNDNIKFSDASSICYGPSISYNADTNEITLTGTFQALPTESEMLGESLYVIGDFNSSWDLNTNYQLAKTSNGVYQGKIAIPKMATNYFRIFSSIEYGYNSYTYGPASDTQINTNSSSTYSGTATYNSDGSWYLKDWDGGILDITFNATNRSISITMSNETVYPENVYIPGNFNEWTEDAEDYKLAPTQTEGIYEGTFNIPATVLYNEQNEYPQFKVYDGSNWIGTDKSTTTSSGGEGNYAVELTSGNPTVLTTSSNADSANWELKNWNGGEITFTYNYDESTLTLFWDDSVDPADLSFYLVGANVDGQSWTFSEDNMLTWDETANAYVWEGKTLYSEFKITNIGTWTDAREFGSNGKGLVIGEDYAFSTNEEESVGNIALAEAGKYVANPKLVLDYEEGIITLTGTLTTLPFDYPETIWLVGPFTGWERENQEYVLNQDADTKSLYTGTITLPATCEYDDEDVNSAQFKIAYATTDWSTTFGNTTSEALTIYKDGSKTTEFLQGAGENWIIENWAGGDMVLTLDYEAKTLTITCPDQPEYVAPDVWEELYLTGNFNNWNTEDSDYQLKTEDGIVYTGTFEFEGGVEYEENNVTYDNTLAFKVFSGSWETSYGAYANATLSLQVEANTNLKVNMSKGDGTPNWIIDGWEENGNIDFSVNIKDLTLTINSSQSEISSLNSAVSGGEAIYNLQGVRVDRNHLGKGIYIINGKKVLVK